MQSSISNTMPKHLKLIKKYSLIFLIFVAILIIGFYYYNKNVREEITIPACTDCNVIIIDLGTVRSDHLGSYGYFRNTSPNIDDLARDGVVFKNTFSQSSYTLPSVMSMFTSLYPISHQMNIPLRDNLNPNVLTLAQILKVYNYTTVWVGPFNDENLPLGYGIDRGFKNYYNARVSLFNPKIIYWTEASNWLENNANKTKFFMYLHTYRSHTPYVSVDEVIKRFTNTTNPKIPSSYEEIMEMAWKRINDNPSVIFKEETIEKNSEIFNMNYSYEKKLKMFELTKNFNNIHATLSNVLNSVYFANVNLTDAEDIQYLKTLYDATIFESDLDVKHIVEKIDETGVRNKTIIIITSAHGEELMDHGEFKHARTLYEEVINIPLMFLIPNFKLDKPVEGLVQSIDIMPTVLDLLNITIPAQAQGISLVSMIENKEDAPHNEYVYGELHLSSGLVSVRSKEWKYIVDLKENKTELYDLINDPGETNNLATIRKDVVQIFEREFEKYMSAEKFTQIIEFPQWISNETKTKIEKEGYW